MRKIPLFSLFKTGTVLLSVLLGVVIWVTMGVSHRFAIRHNFTKQSKQEVKMVLIVAYMRSGSSFTGKLFDANPDAFYVFEPLYHIYERALKYPDFLTRVAKSNGPFPVAENVTLFARDLLHSYLTCNIRGISVINFYDLFLKESSKTYSFQACGKSHRSCIDQLSLACNQSNIRAIKTIRLRMDEAVKLLDHLPSLKVVHLLRDPRGVISSRMRHFGNYKKIGDIYNDVFDICKSMLEDMESAERYEIRNSDRIMRLMYEDLAERPEVMAAELYRFINSPRPESVRKWIENNTRATKDQELNTFMGTARRNSAETAYSWRSRISIHLSRFVDEKCQDVYLKLGYLPAQSLSMLKNLSVPLRSKYSR